MGPERAKPSGELPLRRKQHRHPYLTVNLSAETALGEGDNLGVMWVGCSICACNLTILNNVLLTALSAPKSLNSAMEGQGSGHSIVRVSPCGKRRYLRQNNGITSRFCSRVHLICEF